MIEAFSKNEQVKKVFRPLFIGMAGMVLARVIDAATAQQIFGIITGFFSLYGVTLNGALPLATWASQRHPYSLKRERSRSAKQVRVRRRYTKHAERDGDLQKNSRPESHHQTQNPECDTANGNRHNNLSCGYRECFFPAEF
jgi:hypothetical protein